MRVSSEFSFELVIYPIRPIRKGKKPIKWNSVCFESTKLKWIIHHMLSDWISIPFRFFFNVLFKYAKWSNFIGMKRVAHNSRPLFGYHWLKPAFIKCLKALTHSTSRKRWTFSQDKWNGLCSYFEFPSNNTNENSAHTVKPHHTHFGYSWNQNTTSNMVHVSPHSAVLLVIVWIRPCLACISSSQNEIRTKFIMSIKPTYQWCELNCEPLKMK